MKNTLLLALAVGLAGCAVQPGSGVGNGRYLQIFNGTDVVYEMDVVAAGHQNCPNQASLLISKNPNISAKCAHDPTSQPMPFSYKAHIQTNVQDEFKPSSPFVVRLSTSARCKAAMEASRAQAKTVILEDHCSLPTSDSSTRVPTATLPASAAVKPSAPVQPAPEGVSRVTPTTPAPTVALPSGPPSVSNSARDEAASLQKLKELRDKGLVSQEEYEKKRKEILDRL